MTGYSHNPRGWVFAAVLLGFLTGCQADDQAAAKAGEAAPKPVAVDVVTLTPESITLTTELPGRIMPFRIAQVRPQVDGIVIDRLLREGLEVVAGQPLYQIDPRRFEAAMITARAELKKAQANLAAVKITEKRYQGLLGTQAVSEQQYDDVKALLQQREAEVAVAQAALEMAEVDLQYTLVRAPIEGRIEQFMVTEGAMVEEFQDMPMATIRQLDPIYIDMNQAAKDLVRIRKAVLADELKRAEKPRLHLQFEDGTPYEHTGEVLYEELNVNMDTGMVLVRAIVANPDRLLMPGQFVKVTIEEGVLDNALLVPQAAVVFSRQGDPQAYVVGDDSKAVLRTLRLGQAIDDRFLVKAGLNAGDRVVVSGLQKIRAGVLLQPAVKAELPRQGGE